MAISNNAEGFTTDPTTPTTSNTGGSSGTACSTVAQGTSSTIAATHASALFGTFGYEFSLVNNTSDGACRLMWSLSSSTRTVLSCYYRTSDVITAFEDIMGVRHPSGNMALLSVGSDGKIVPVNSASASQTAMKATNALAANTTYLIQMAVTKGTTTSNGTIEWAYWDATGATQLDTFSSSTQNTTTNNVAAVFVGRSTGRGMAHTAYYDEINGDTLSSGWITPGSVTAVAATGSGLAVAPTVSAEVGGNVSAVAATGSGLMLAPEVEGQVVVSGGGPMAATGAMIAPAITTGAVVTAVAATATALFPAPGVTGGAAVVAVAATGSGAMVAPVVSGSSASEVVAPAATGTGQMIAPTVTGVQVGDVAAVAATSSGSMPAPTVTGGAALTTVVMTATGAAVAPVVVGGVAGTAQAVTATATGQMLSPSVAAERWADVAAAPGLASALMLAPVVLGGAQVSPAAMACAGSLPSPVVAGHGPYNFQRVAKRTFTVSQGTRTYKVRRQR